MTCALKGRCRVSEYIFAAVVYLFCLQNMQILALEVRSCVIDLLFEDVLRHYPYLPISDCEGSITLLPTEPLEVDLFMDPLGGGVLDISHDVGHAVNRPESGENVDMIVGTTNRQAHRIERTECAAKVRVEIGSPRRRDYPLPPPGGEDDVKIEFGICPGHDFTMAIWDQLILNLGTNRCSAPSGRRAWPDAWAMMRSPFGARLSGLPWNPVGPEEPAPSESEGGHVP